MNSPRWIAEILRSSTSYTAANKKCILPSINLLQSNYTTANKKNKKNKSPPDSTGQVFSGSSAQEITQTKDTNLAFLDFSDGNAQKNSLKQVGDSEPLGLSDPDFQKKSHEEVEDSKRLRFSGPYVQKNSQNGDSERAWLSAAEARLQNKSGNSKPLGFSGATLREISQKQVSDSELPGFSVAELQKSSVKKVGDLEGFGFMGADDREISQEQVRELPRPSEIPWQAKVANSVHLIGRVSMPVQFEANPDGGHWAATVLLQEKTVGLPPFWVPVIFEGDLAEIAACHLRENDLVYVCGQLSADSSRFSVEHCQTSLQVMVHDVNFVEKNYLKKITLPLQGKKEQSSGSSGSPWTDLLANPQKWLDYRLNKLNGSINPRHPDFKHKDTGEPLWLQSSPEWALKNLEGLEFSVGNVKQKQENGSPWTDLLANPQKWLDYRLNKLNGSINPRYPDFKHKDTGEPLWLKSSPEWALQKLEGLEFSVGNVKQKQENGMELWADLVSNQNKWWDCRLNKINTRYPDFKHKESGEGLWLKKSTPAWVVPNLKNLDQWKTNSKS